MDFPLYSTLSIKLPKKDLTIAQKSDFIKKIQEMDSDGCELIFALIKSYYIDKDKGNCMSIPYSGKLGKDKIDFDLLNLPIPLRQLLYKFMSLHKKKLKEDEIFNLRSEI